MEKERLADFLYRKAILPLSSYNPEAAHEVIFTIANDPGSENRRLRN